MKLELSNNVVYQLKEVVELFEDYFYKNLENEDFLLISNLYSQLYKKYELNNCKDITINIKDKECADKFIRIFIPINEELVKQKMKVNECSDIDYIDAMFSISTFMISLYELL